MFAGHTAFALFARRARPAIPFALLFVAAYAPDVVEVGLRVAQARLDPLLWSHSIPAVAAQAAIAAVAVLAGWRDVRGAWIAALAVLSHWPADFITGMNKPTWAGGPRVGLFLYDHPVADVLLECGLIAVAWWVSRPAFRGSWRRLAAVGVVAMLSLQAAFGLRSEQGGPNASGKGNLLRSIAEAVRRLAPSEARHRHD